MTNTKETTSNKFSRTTFNFYSKELFEELEAVLGVEFQRLPKRIQSGYANVLTKHHNIVKSNQHLRDSESFFMEEEEVEAYFNDIRDFRAVNDNGYYLRQNKKQKGKYILCPKSDEQAEYFEPTHWLLSTVSASQGIDGYPGWSNGFQISPKLMQLFEEWQTKVEKKDVQLIYINHKDKTLEEVTEEAGGAIFRNLSTTDSSINVNPEVGIDKTTLQAHKEQLIDNLEEVEELDGIGWRVNSQRRAAKRKQIEEKLRVGEERGGGRGSQPGIGGVKSKYTPSSHLKSLIDKGFSKDSFIQRIDEIDRLSLLSTGKKIPTVSVVYSEATTGRYTAKGGVLQSYNKSVRYAALKGCYEYDLEAAHQNILLQLLLSYNTGFEFTKDDSAGIDALYYYTRYKSDLRETLMMELNTEYEVVKDVLQGLTYGAELTKSNRRAIYKACYGEEHLIQQVVNHSWIKDYAEAFKLAQRMLIGNQKTITNDVGITIESKGKAKDVAHIIQGCERQVLDAVIKHSNREDIALLVHDCVVFYNKQSASELSRIVKEETGFELEFSEEQY